MEIIEAGISDSSDDFLEMRLIGDEEEWMEIISVLKESDSDLATELGIKIRAAIKNISQ